MAIVTSPESPAPLRQVSQLMGDWIGRMGAIWVEGEIAQLNRRPGMCFLTLRDLTAKISVSVTCHVSVLDSSPTPITEGARVVVHAKPEFYATSGRLSLNAREIRPTGIGELLARLEQRKQLLAAEGLFDPRLKRPLPFLPRLIGLITGRESAAEKDVLENARLRWPGVRFEVRYALMQGNESARQVMAELKLLDDHPEVDVIIIARGGGSMEDLLSFSDEALVRAVAGATTPIVSAIGHEQDTPIIDLAADLRASTPTDAAKRVVPDFDEQISLVNDLRGRSAKALNAYLAHQYQGLAHMRSRPSLANPGGSIDAEAVALEASRSRLRLSLTNRLDRAHDEIGHHLARVRGLSPRSTLVRGYAIAQAADGAVITSVATVSPDDELHIRVADGQIRVRTLDIHSELDTHTEKGTTDD
ncbi:MAG: exodeoxyribonuclease large subunit [Nocardioidaceae bacterium]|nr:exodeoxyribonuclease large subunit [Nocardioidaceae bacterium]